jgi:hypothetical protein
VIEPEVPAQVVDVPEPVAVVAPVAASADDAESAAQEFIKAMAVEGASDDDADSTGVKGDKKKDKDKNKKAAKGVLVFDEELGRMVVQRSRKPSRADDFGDDLDE